MSQRILVAGVGNIFLGDDGFGVEVARRLAAKTLPDSVRIADFGIRGVHLAYDLLEYAYETAILVDAAPRGGKPGTVYLIEPASDGADGETSDVPDAHGMHPAAVLALLKTLGGTPGRILIVGCEPCCVEEGIGLSPPVSKAVEEAIMLIEKIIAREGSATRPPP
jgi:hydrogenase maturation protease